MNGIRVIPVFLFLITMSFLGAIFVEANSQVVSVHFLGHESPPMKLGLIIMISCFLGTLFAGLLCSIEILALAIQNKRLKKRLHTASSPPTLSLSKLPEFDKSGENTPVGEGTH